MHRLRAAASLKGGMFDITEEQYAQIAHDMNQPFYGEMRNILQLLEIYLFNAPRAMYLPKSLRDLFGHFDFQTYLPVFMSCVNMKSGDKVEEYKETFDAILIGKVAEDSSGFHTFLDGGFKWGGTDKVELVVIRPNIEHNMLGVVIGRGGLDDLGATLWGQTELSVYDDSMHGIWGMSYKYNERAIVYNERNLIRLWDVAYDGYNGGKDCRHVVRAGRVLRAV